MKTIGFAKLCLALALCVPMPLVAQNRESVNLPATRPSATEISTLIGNLGHEDFKTREAATNELRKIGQPAVAALKDAAKSPDPEVQARAQSLLKDIENASKPKANVDREVDFGPWGNGNANGQVRIFINGQAVNVGQGNNFRVSKTVTVVNNRKQIEVTENQQSVSITEDANGIRMSVTDVVEGKETTKKYEAKNAAELKEKHPEAFKIYEKNTREGAGARAHAPRPLRPGVRFAPKPADPDDLRIELPPEILRELPPEMQREFGPRPEKQVGDPTTRPATTE